VLAGILGFIPGVGAVYNGQFAKGILHVMIFGLLVSIVAADGTGDLRPMFVFLLILMGIYMPIEAYRTARSIERGEPVEEFSGILSVFGSKKPSPAGGVVLIVVGVVLLLNTLGYWRLGDLVRFWPVLLVALGAYMLYRSVSEQAREDRMAALGGSLRGMNAEQRRPPASEAAGLEPRPVEDGIEEESSLHNPSSG
jgi:putative Mn2+ efflux pump MntP